MKILKVILIALAFASVWALRLMILGAQSGIGSTVTMI